MPRARTTTQGPRFFAAVRRTAVAAVLAAVLAALLAGLGVLAPDRAAAAAGSPARIAQQGPAGATSPGGSPEPTAAQRGSADETSPADRPPSRLGGAVTPRRYGLPTVLAAVLVLGVASLQVRLLLAEPAARPGANASANPGANPGANPAADPAARPGAPPAEPSAAPGPGPDRRQGIGPPRW